MSYQERGFAAPGFVVPGEPGEQLHFILGVIDDDASALTRYRRVICSIK